MRRVLYLALAFVVTFRFSIFYDLQNLQPRIVIDGITWTQVLYWDFGGWFVSEWVGMGRL